MKTPFFSIIVPTLNEEQYLPRLLESLGKQRFREFEVVLVDGGSEDKTVVLAQKYTRLLPRLVILNHKRKNVSEQRNVGVFKATGRYVVFFDADVEIPRNFLTGVSRIIEKKRSFLLTTWVRPDTRQPQDQVITAVGNIGMEAANFVDKPFAGGFNIFIDKHIFQCVGGFNDKLTMSEDHELVQRCLKAGIRMTILRHPRMTMSMRRFRQYGYLAIVRTYSQSVVYTMLKKPITKALIDYPMGGHLYKDKKQLPKISLSALEKQLLNAVKKFIEL